MRYYDVAFKTNEDELRENNTIKLGSYEKENIINSLGSYIQKHTKNGIAFFPYRCADNSLFASFAFDESKYDLPEAFEYILTLLYESFRISKVNTEPQEITMYQCIDNLKEGKRREYTYANHHLLGNAKLWLYDYMHNDNLNFHFDFDEKIIKDELSVNNALYDKSLLDEVENISNHVKSSEYVGNMVHYVISSRSIEAATDMTEVLTKSLYKANRIKSRRIEIISNIEPDIIKIDNHLEKIIENNFGGVIIFELTEKFGYDPVDYAMVSKYIVNLLKKYRNQCLFVFTYNMDNPGFSYSLIPEITKYVIPVYIREGTGDRKAAINYMKSLIKNSDYAKFARQASEYMKLYPGNEFTQTDVLSAYEQFDAWCLNKNFFNAYTCDVNGDFMLDRDENAESSYEKLQKLIGLSIVKKQIDNIIATDIVEKERKRRIGRGYQTSSMHMVFAGNPGSAKTTVAKLFAGIAKEKGVLKSGAFVERGGMDLDGLGCIYAIREAFQAAKGGVLFIDEAYSMKSDVAVTTLIQEMENQRDNVIVILAGYNDRMQKFVAKNEGFKSRVPYWIEFPDYDTNELTEIFKLMIAEKGFSITDKALNEATYIFEKSRHIDNFGNGRFVRNLLEHALQNQSVRVLSKNIVVEKIKRKDLFQIVLSDISNLDDGKKEERIPGTAQNELAALIGLESAKQVINKAIANYKINRMCLERGIKRGKSSMHMVFTGNPGTAKTTVARLFAEIMKDEKVLSTGNFIEVGRADLIGEHVGETAPLVKKKFKEAQGGVLFIDEAYSLCDGYKNGYGDEAINTLVQEMENHREDVIVIFAGYPEPMSEFLDRNPGMKSRIAFNVSFEDYTLDELRDITELMLSQKQMTISDIAMNKLIENYKKVINNKDYGNGRYVRKLLEEAEMNLAQRLIEMKEEDITNELITRLEECDITIHNNQDGEKKTKIGFAC